MWDIKEIQDDTMVFARCCDGAGDMVANETF